LNPRSADVAVSNLTGTILLIAIVIILAAIFLHFFTLPSFPNNTVPCVFQITKIRDVRSDGQLTYDSYLVLVNTADTAFDNWNLYVLTYRNGEQIPARIVSLNNNEFISSVHDGVSHLVGEMSTRGSKRDRDGKWYPGALLAIDYSDGTFHPGDVVTLDIYDKANNTLISRDTWPHTDPRLKTGWWIDQFTHQGT